MREDRERRKDRESGGRDGKEDWGFRKRGIDRYIRTVEQREDRKRDDVVSVREVEHMEVMGRLGEVVYEFNMRLLTQLYVQAIKTWRHFIS